MTVRFSDDELAELHRAAEVGGLTVAGFCGSVALVAARPGNASNEPLRDQLAELQRQVFEARIAVNRVGTNLNQAVAALNATDVAPVWLAHAVDRSMVAVQRLDEVASRIHRRLK